MRTAFLTLLFAALGASNPLEGLAQADFDGYWDFVITSEEGEPQLRMRVGLSLSQGGRLQGETGVEGPSEMTGSILGSDVELRWKTEFQGLPVDFRFTGTTDEDGMSGSVEVDFGDAGGVSQSRWTAVRAEPRA